MAPLTSDTMASLLLTGPDPFAAKVCEILGEDIGVVRSITLHLEAGKVAELTVRRLLSQDEIRSLADACENPGIAFQQQTTYACLAQTPVF